MEPSLPRKHWKQRLLHEITEYLLNFIYLAIFFSAIIFYRRMVLAQYDIHLDDYFMGVVKALIIAKVVMIGAFMRVSRKFEHSPLIVPVLYKAALFTVLVMLFDLIEASVRGAIENPTAAHVLQSLESHVSYEWLAALLLIFISFIPFFALKEMMRVMGTETVRDLFLRARNPAP